MPDKRCHDPYQKLVHAMRNLPLRACDGDLVARHLGAWKHDLALVLALEFVDLVEASKELAMVETINVDDLGGILGILVEMLAENGR